MPHNKPCQCEVLKNISVDFSTTPSSKSEYFKKRVLLRKLINPPKIKPLAICISVTLESEIS